MSLQDRYGILKKSCMVAMALACVCACTAPATQPLVVGGGLSARSSHDATISGEETVGVQDVYADQCNTTCDIVTGTLLEIEPPPAGGRDANGELWDGYVQGGSPTGGSDRLRFWLSSVDNDGTVTGVVRFGDADLVQQPTSPDQQLFGLDVFENPHAPTSPMEGYNYEIEEGMLTAGRLTFKITPIEAMTGYCALQTPLLDCTTKIETDKEEWSCLPYSSPGAEFYGGSDGCTASKSTECPTLSVPCPQFTYCVDGLCICDANGCRPDNNYGSVSFDLRLEGDDLQGTYTGYAPSQQVFLTRM